MKRFFALLAIIALPIVALAQNAVVPELTEIKDGIYMIKGNGGNIGISVGDDGVFMIDDPNRFMYTAKLTSRFRQPVPTETPLRITAQIVKDRGRLAESKAKLYNLEGELLAEAEALLAALPKEFMQSSDVEALGWRVYPDKEPAA